MFMLIVDPKYTTIKINSMNEQLSRKTDDFGNLLLTGSFPFSVTVLEYAPDIKEWEEVILTADEIAIQFDDSVVYDTEFWNEEWF